MTSIVTQEEIEYYEKNAFEKQKRYKKSKFVFCKITYPTLPEAINYTRKVLCTAVAKIGKFGTENDVRTEKLKAFLNSRGPPNPDFLVALCSRTPVRLGYTARLYDVAESKEGLRDIKEMYLKEDEVVVRAQVGSYDIVDAISASDAVDEYKQLYEKISLNYGKKLIEAQESSGYYRELVCWLQGKTVTVKEFNKLIEEIDPSTGHNKYTSESFMFTDKQTGRPYNGEFTIETSYEHGKESEATYTFRSYSIKSESNIEDY